MSLKVVAISDTHNLHDKLNVPEGDVLVHAGDLTKQGTIAEWSAAAKWLGSLPHKHKVVIAGNHDFIAETNPTLAKQIMEDNGVTYLLDECVHIEGYCFYGSPWQPWLLS